MPRAASTRRASNCSAKAMPAPSATAASSRRSRPARTGGSRLRWCNGPGPHAPRHRRGLDARPRHGVRQRARRRDRRGAAPALRRRHVALGRHRFRHDDAAARPISRRPARHRHLRRRLEQSRPARRRRARRGGEGGRHHQRPADPRGRARPRRLVSRQRDRRAGLVPRRGAGFRRVCRRDRAEALERDRRPRARLTSRHRRPRSGHDER